MNPAPLVDPDPVRSAARARPDTVAIIDQARGIEHTYAELDDRVAGIAAGLVESGVDVGDRLGVVGEIHPAVVEAVHAIRRSGATVVPLDPALPVDRLHDRVTPVGLEIVLATGAWASEHPLATAIDTYRSRVPSDGLERRGPSTTAKESTAAILYTSGTTGRANGVRLTDRNLQTSAWASALRLGVDPSDRWIGCLAPHHMGGFAPIVRTAVYGTGLVLQPFDSGGIESAITEASGTGISLVPTQLRRALDDGVPLDALRVVLVGGDRTPPDLVERCLENGVPVHTTYGMTETASQVATATPSELRTDPQTVGRPLRWTGIEIRSDTADRRVEDTEGELVVSGPTVSPGYVNGSDADRFPDRGTVRTGDLGHLDAAGRLRVTGRGSDRIVSGGVSVDPRRVETTLCAAPGVEAAAVVGIADADWGERVVAVVVQTDPGAADPAAIWTRIEARLRPAERPKSLEIVDRLPRTASGTVDRARVRALFDPDDATDDEA